MTLAVVIRPEAFGIGFDVIAPDPTLSRELPDLTAARAYATDIAAARNWTIDDRCDR